jgi:histidinol phosphatase-like enzyme
VKVLAGQRPIVSALFLDRDGVINVDRGYVHRLDQFEFVSGIFPLARFWADELRRPIVVVSNPVRQSVAAILMRRPMRT